MFDWYLFRRNIVNLQKPPKWWAPSLFGWIRYFPFIKGFCQHSQMWYLQGLRNLDAPRDRIVLDFGSSDLVSSGVFWTGIILPSDIYETWNRLWFSKVRLWIPKTELGNFCEWSLYNTKQDQKKTITVLWILHNGATLHAAQSSRQSSWGWNVKSFLRYSWKFATFRIMIKVLG